MDTCRTCHSTRMQHVIDLGNHPPAQRFMSAEQLREPEPSAPLTVYACLDCALIQVADNVPAGFFTHYLYVSSTSDQLVRHFEGFAQTLVSRFVTPQSRRIGDIGSCDGVLLAAARALGAETTGIEPATNLAEIARGKGLDVENAYFSPEVARRVRERTGPFAAIAMSNTFNIIDDLDAVVEGVKLMLADDGAFVVEVPQAADLVEKNEFDTVYHEHLSQFSVHSLAALFGRHGMEIFDLERLTLHGGSMRVFVQRQGVPRAVATALARERAAGLFDAATYDAFRDRVQANRDAFRTLVQGLRAEGKRIAGYGAAAKGTTLLNYYGIGPDLLDFIADRNAMKHGLLSPGMHIPVSPTERILEDQPDYLVILAWNFADEIMAQQAEYRRRGGRFIVPIPQPEVVA
jgi:C-methyltransferase C-terminal domain/Putative zinc binding domain/Methyltransferase domain